MIYDYDIIIIGGGATGLGCAVEAISRGYRVLVLEGHDFGKGTSSKSTKLVHGGLRYLANLDIALVKEGLEERYYFLKNAPHLAHKQSYLIPLRNYFEKLKYFIGTKLYDSLAGSLSIGNSRSLSKSQTIIEATDLDGTIIAGGAIYLDGQFDDTRVLISLVKTFESCGGIVKNYHLVKDINEVNNQVHIVSGINTQTQQEFKYSGRIIINATGTFSDHTLDIADKSQKHSAVEAAQGTHLVFDKTFFNSKHAILIPETVDGRVLFILPWHDKIVVGTTDVKVTTPTLEPQAQASEIEFILSTFNQYSKNKVNYGDIKSVFCGQRPLVKPNNSTNTAKISRKHELSMAKNGVVTIVGGKWTIYRRMGVDTINYIEDKFNLTKTNSVSKNLKLYGYTTKELSYPLNVYGSMADKVIAIQKEFNNYEKLHQDLPYLQSEVIYHVREELACTVEDVLLRRTRAMFLDAKAALECAPIVAKLMARELNKSDDWVKYQLLEIQVIAKKFMYNF